MDELDEDPPILDELVDPEQLAVTETVNGSQVGQFVGKTELVPINEVNVEIIVGQLVGEDT